MKYVKIPLLVLVVIAVILGGLILKTYRDAGEFKKIKPHFNGICTDIMGVASSEDITIHPHTGFAFISSDDRRSAIGNGAIYGFNLESKGPKPMNLTAGFNKPFHPHGIGLLFGDDNLTSLFVVNHHSNKHFVEIFDFDPVQYKLIHRESIHGSLMHSPNDVIPVGPNSFYVTNDHGSVSDFGRMIEDYLQLAKSYVLFFDGKEFRIVAKGFAYSNGINISKDGKSLYVASTVGRKITVFDRDPSTNDLKHRYEINMGTGVDNIEMDSKGSLWIGAHPKLLTFIKHSKDPDVLSPTQVIRLDFQGKDQYKAYEVLMDPGSMLSGSSVAAVYKRNLLIGAVFDSKFILCYMKR
jgi:arylesterase/paraoxonase